MLDRRKKKKEPRLEEGNTLLVSFIAAGGRWSYVHLHILLLFKIIASQVKRRVPPRRALNAAILIWNARESTGNCITGEICAHYFILSTMISYCCRGSPYMPVWRWVKGFLMHLHKVCQCIFVSMCSFPTELLNYQLLLFLCVCARVCVGINAFIFVDVIMFICMFFFFLCSNPVNYCVIACSAVIKCGPGNIRVCMHV